MLSLATIEPATDATHPAREERRPVSLPGWLTRPGQEATAHDFVIDNLSYGGCRMQSAARLERGDAVSLTVLRRGAIPGVVRWHNAYGIGVSFTPEPPERIETPRKVERVPVQTALAVRQTGRRPRSVPATDLSRFGCCLTFDDLPMEGEGGDARPVPDPSAGALGRRAPRRGGIRPSPSRLGARHAAPALRGRQRLIVSPRRVRAPARPATPTGAPARRPAERRPPPRGPTPSAIRP